MSFTDECNYLGEKIADLKEKIKMPFWHGWEYFFKTEIIKLERQLYLIKEQEVCEQLTSTKTTNTISQCLSIQEN